jgi:hypothetical protein
MLSLSHLQSSRSIWLVVALLSLAMHAPLLGTLLLAIPPDPQRATDFMAFWAAAKLVWQGSAELAYNAQAVSLASGVAGAALPPSFYPPPYLFITAPLGMLDYQTAYLVFVPTSMALLAFFFVIVFRAQAGLALLLILAFGGLWQLLHYGQNSGWIALLYLLVFSSLQAGSSRGGVALGLAIIKPHLGVLAPVHLLLTRQWRLLLVTCLTAIILIALTTLALSPQIWPAYAEGARYPIERMSNFSMNNIYAPISLYAGLRRLGLDGLSAILIHAGFALAMLWVWLRLVARLHPAHSFALLPLVTLLVLPHAYAYDSVLLLLPILAIALCPELRPKSNLALIPWALLYLSSTWLAVFNVWTIIGIFPFLGAAALVTFYLTHSQPKLAA